MRLPRGTMTAPAFVCSLFGRAQNSLLTVEKVRRMRDSRNLRGLTNALSHDNPDIQYEAVEALGALREPAAIPSLMALFTSEGYSGVRWKIAEALAGIGTPAVDPLIAALGHADEDVRWKAAIALGGIRDARAIDPLIRLLSDPDRFVKSRAAIALGMIGVPAVDPLVCALQKGDGDMRWGAAIALGRIRDLRATEALICALADKYENVRAEAAAALAAIGPPATGPLLRFLKFADSTARIEVMNTLGDIRAADAIEPLIQMLENADEGERREIAAILDSILTPTAEAYARRIWDDAEQPEILGDHGPD